MDTENVELGHKIEICRDTSTAETETCGFYNDHSMSKKKLSTAIILSIADGVKANSLAVLTEARGTSALRFCLLCHLHLLLIRILDLTSTFIFSVLAVARTLSTTRKLLDILMETAPREIDCSRLAGGLCDMDEVMAVHKLHVWAITFGKVCLACHVRIKPEADTDGCLTR